MKKILITLFAGFIIAGLLGCRHRRPFAGENIQPAGKEYYTTVNIWYEHPQETLSTNYHAGTIIPAGSKVRIIRVTGETISFEALNTSAEYRLVHVKRHSIITMEEYFNWHFSRTDPLGDDGKFASFTDLEKKHVKAGTLAKGMSKDAVVMAYGYPPTHETPSLKSSSWQYWTRRFDTLVVRFEGDRVSEIVD